MAEVKESIGFLGNTLLLDIYELLSIQVSNSEVTSGVSLYRKYKYDLVKEEILRRMIFHADKILYDCPLCGTEAEIIKELESEVKCKCGTIFPK